jgi:hypothetical protein
MAGRDRAEAVAGDLGLAAWDARHDSGAFELTRPFAMTALRNVLAFRNRDELGIELSPGIDEVSARLPSRGSASSHVATGRSGQCAIRRPGRR